LNNLCLRLAFSLSAKKYKCLQQARLRQERAVFAAPHSEPHIIQPDLPETVPSPTAAARYSTNCGIPTKIH
jgi:hypothetical protein